MAEKYVKLVSKFLEVIIDVKNKFGYFFWAIPAVAVLLVAFVIGLALSFGGDLGKFKKVAKQAMAIPTNANFQATAKAMPIAVRKQYKEAKLSGKKPSDVITLDACVYSPYNVSVASRFPSMMTAFGVLAILLTYAFVAMTVVDPVTFFFVILLAVVLRLIAGIVSRSVLSSGVKTYHEYVDKLDNYLKIIPGSEQPQAAAASAEAPAGEAQATEAHASASYNAAGDIPFASADEPIKPMEYSFGEPAAQQSHAYGATFEPERIAVEEVPEEPVVMAPPTESEEELKARARAEAMARARAEQAQRAQAAQTARQAQAQPQQAQAPRPAQAARPTASSGLGSMNAGAEEVIARINKITQEGAPLATMKEAALQLQKERAKPENKTPEMQRKLNEALAALLKAMSSANKK